MKIIIRVDANKKVALGHLKRCMALSQEIIARGMKPLFLCTNDEMAKIALDGFDVIWTNSEIGSSDDASFVINSALVSGISIILLDSHNLTDKYLRQISNASLKVIIFDDLGKNYEGVFGVINGLPISEQTYSCRHKLLGLDYLVLSPCYSAYVRKNPRKTVNRIVITVGGIDHFDIIPWAINVLNDISMSFKILLEIDIVIGPYFDNESKIHREIKKSNLQVNIHKSPPSLFEILSSADVAITGGGGTVYELLRMGIPSVAIGLSDQQNLNLSLLSKFNVLQSILGERNKISSKHLVQVKNELISIIFDYSLRKKISEAGASIIDGAGSQRICNFLEGIEGNE